MSAVWRFSFNLIILFYSLGRKVEFSLELIDIMYMLEAARS